MKVYAAFRRGHAYNANIIQRAANNINKTWLHTDYPHGGIVVNGTLFHSSFFKGVTEETLNANEHWEKYEANISLGLAMTRLALVMGKKYDWFSLLSFLPFVKARDSKRFYCWELMIYVLTGEIPRRKVTAETVMRELLKCAK
jgi:hypothetical protein